LTPDHPSGELRALGEELGSFFRRLVEGSPLATGVHVDGRWVYLNAAAVSLLGANDAGELLGTEVLTSLAPADRERARARIAEVVARGKPSPPTVYAVHSHGAWRDVEVVGLPIEVGRKRGVQVVMRDLTEWRRAEQALRESEEKFATAFRASPLAIVISNLEDGRLLEINESFTRMTGWERPDVIGRSGVDLGLWADRSTRDALYAAVRATGAAREIEASFCIKNGERRIGRLFAERIDLAGEPRVLILAEDVTDRHRAEVVQTATYRIAQAAHEVRSLDELYPAIHAIVADLMPATNFYIALYDRNEGQLEFPYYVDELDAPPGGPVPLGRGMTEYVLRTGQAMLATPQRFRELLDRGEVDLVGSPSVDWLGVPLKVAGNTTGVLVVQSYTEGVRFGQGDLEILRFVSDQVAMAIERRRAEDAERRRDALLRSVAEVVSAATGDVFFRSLVRELARSLGCAYAFVGALRRAARGTGGRTESQLAVEPAPAAPPGQLPVHPDDAIETIAVCADGQIADNFSYELSGTPCRGVIAGQMCLYADAVADRFPGDELLCQLGVRCYVGVPLFDAAQLPLGLLVVMDRKPLRDTETTRALLQIFAARAAAELERRRSEETLRESEARYRLFIEQSSEAIWCVEFARPVPVDLPVEEQIERVYREGVMADCNLPAAQMYGHATPAGLIGTPVARILPDEDPRSRLFVEAVVRSGYRLTDAESHEVDHHGRPRVFVNNLVGIIEGGAVRRIWGTQRDITERRRAEVVLDQQAAAIRASMDGMAIFDHAGRVVYANESYARTYGWASAEGLHGVPWEACYPVPEVERLRQQVLPAVWKHGEWRGTATGRRADGASFPQEISLTRIEGGGMVAVVRDITERRALEEQLRQAQKMEAVGRLAGGVAHDFNNLLTAITGYSDLLLARLGSDHVLRREVEEIKRAGVRAADLTRQLLAFSRRQVLSARQVNLNRTVADMEKLLRRVIGEDIHLATELAGDLGIVRADPGQLEQVIMNLAVNARDAMPQGGELRLVTRNCRLDEDHARRFLDVRPGDYVVLEVHDNGEGIPPDVREHIFEPFFTTKEVGRGTGLGLSMVYGIVRQSGGHIEVESGAETGTVFRIYLPQVLPEAESDQVPAVQRSPPGSETVLVVEDEPAVQQLVRRILEDRGYRVLVAPHGVAALGMMGDHVDLLLTDVVMPGMSGAELAEQLRQLREDLAVLYMSGYTESFVGRRGVQGTGDFLQKPFTPEVLAQRVRQVLDERRGKRGN
jgi:two-component system cell cycle sensor histidine kinase/response regulator CckA